jgi:ABC-type transporter MlaC component
MSLISTQRSDFAAPISQKGLDFFLDRLGKKVQTIKK